MRYLVLLVVLAAGCKQSVDNDVAEKLVKKILEREQMKPTDVSCPKNQPIAVGTTFDCTANAAGHVEVVVHVTEVDHTTEELSAEGAGGDYKLVGAVDDGIVSRRRIAQVAPGVDASKCAEAQKLAKVGDVSSCEVTLDGQKKHASSKRTDKGVEIKVE